MMLGANPSIVDRRVLGAVELADGATGERITAPMVFKSDLLGFVRNRAGLYAINRVAARTAQEKALRAHLSAFEAAPGGLADGAVAVDVTIEDPTRRYVPRMLSLALPRGAQTGTPIRAEMYPGAAAPVGQNWSGLRMALRRRAGSDEVPLAGARITLLRDSDDAELGRGYTDIRGEALVIAVGIPVIDFTTDTGTSPSALVGTKKVTARIEVHTGPGQAWPPNPEAIETSGQAWVPDSGTLPKPELATGSILSAGLSFLMKPQP